MIARDIIDATPAVVVAGCLTWLAVLAIRNTIAYTQKTRRDPWPVVWDENQPTRKNTRP